MPRWIKLFSKFYCDCSLPGKNSGPRSNAKTSMPTLVRCSKLRDCGSCTKNGWMRFEVMICSDPLSMSRIVT